MTRWIAFDSASANALARRIGNEAVIADSSTDPIQAVSPGGHAIALLPSTFPDQLLVATIYRRGMAPAGATARPVPHNPGVKYVASGFLGLEDAVVLEEEPARRRSWWQKLWD